MEQDGLHIVAGGVSGGNQTGTRLLRRFAEKGVAHVSGGLLNARPPEPGLTGHVSGAGVQWDGGENSSVRPAVPAAAQLDELLHKPLIPV